MYYSLRFILYKQNQQQPQSSYIPVSDSLPHVVVCEVCRTVRAQFLLVVMSCRSSINLIVNQKPLLLSLKNRGTMNNY
jgi:hypothetical protein